MKIEGLEVENIKRLVKVEITPGDSALVQITGPNGAGKSSVLDAIWWALAGERSHQSAPIRSGETHAHVKLDLGDIIVTREFARKDDGHTTTRLRVENGDGARFPSPQKMLDGLLGSLTFDPLAFQRANDREQFEMLSGLCGLDMAEIEKAHAEDFAARRDWNRQAKSARVMADAITVPADTPAECLSITDLMMGVQAAHRTNRERETERMRRDRESDLVASTRDEAMMLERAAAGRMDRAETEAAALEKRAREIRIEAKADAENDRTAAGKLKLAANAKEFALAALPPVEPDIDTFGLQAEVERAESTNRDVAKRVERNRHLSSAKEAASKADALTRKMDARRLKTRKAIADADLGIEGLTVENGRVMLGEHPFEQASDAERLRASCAIAMRGDAKLRVLRVRDGSLLDGDSLALLGEMAEANSFQVWLECVDTSGKVGIVIEDGVVAKVAEPV